MNKPMLSRLKIRPPLILMGLILVGALLLPVTDMFSNPAAAAVTASECYDYNNTTSGVSTNPTGPKQECVNAGYCTSAFSSGTGGVSGSAGGTVMRFTCSDEVYKASSQYAATAYNQGVLDAQIAPALKTICGDASTSTRVDDYANCASQLQERYTQCADNAERRYSPAEDQVAAAIGTCIQGYYPSTNASAIAAAITQGRTDGAAKATELTAQQQAAAQAKCTEKKLTYAPSSADADADGCTATAAQNATCAGGALGWLLCPVMKLFENINSFMAQQIEKQLVVGPLAEGNPLYTGTRTIWESMVGVANLLLVVGFLVVIFSQATSMGLSAYGIKKMLPRIIAAAILINLSFFLCAIAIDIANVIGGSVQGIISAGGSALKVNGGVSTNFGDWLLQLGGIVLGGAVIVFSGAIAYIVPLAITGIMATMVIFLGLALRKIFIVLLIIVAPLALAAMILPGTEGLFKKWQKSLTGLLIMYPVIVAIMYGSVLVSNIILAQDDSAVTISSTGATVDGKTIPSSSGAATTTVNVSNDNLVTILLAYAVVAIGPFLGTYMFIKNSSKIFGAAAGMVNRVGAGAKKWGDGVAKSSTGRSMLGQAMTNRKAVLDDKARRDSIRKMEAGHGWSRLSGIGLGREGRQIRSTALTDAKKTLDEREVAGHSANLTKQAASMLATGYKREGDKWVARDESGNIRKDSKGNNMEVAHDALDVGTRGSLDYAMKNNLIGNKNGARAIAKSLVDTGEARMDHIERLASAIKDPGERVAFVENTRAAAQSAGLDHLKYMGVDANGNVDFAGVTRSAGYKAPDPKNKAAVAAANVAAKQTVAEKMSNSNLAGINKYAFDETDKTVVDTLGQQLVDIETGSADRFETELAGMGADGVIKMAKMIFKSSTGASMFASEKDAVDHYAALHNAARAKHHA